MLSDCHMASPENAETELFHIDHILNPSHIIDVYEFFFSENCLWLGAGWESNRKLNDKCQSGLYPTRMMREWWSISTWRSKKIIINFFVVLLATLMFYFKSQCEVARTRLIGMDFVDNENNSQSDGRDQLSEAEMARGTLKSMKNTSTRNDSASPPVMIAIINLHHTQNVYDDHNWKPWK